MSDKNIENLDQGKVKANPSCKILRIASILIFLSSLIWLFKSIILGLVYSIKLFKPNFLDISFRFNLLDNGSDFLFSTGIVHELFINCLIYGWGFLAITSLAILLVEKLCNSKIKRPFGIIIAIIVWNITLTLGNISIITGNSSNIGLLWSGGASYVTISFFLCFSYISIKMLMNILCSDRELNKLSKKYLLIALMSFPWMILTVNLFKTCFHGTPTMVTLSYAWYQNAVIYLCFIPFILSIVYYILPKITNKDLQITNISKFGFLSFIFIAPWTGLQQFFGSPVPNWIVVLSSVFMILMIIPTSLIAYDFFSLIKNNFGFISSSNVSKFVYTGIYFYIIGVFLQVLSTFNFFSKLIGHSSFLYAIHLIFVFGSLSMVLFGGVYYFILESEKENSNKFINTEKIKTVSYLHFWSFFYGICLLIGIYMLKGLIIGQSISVYGKSFEGIILSSNGFSICIMISWFLILISFCFFIYLFVKFLINSLICKC